MARFLIVGQGERARALADALGERHEVDAIAEAEPLGQLLGALEHVAIVCWLTADVSPERFLLGAVDSSMRGFFHGPGDWEQAVSETAARNSIPVVALRTDPADLQAWLAEALAAIAWLLEGRYAEAYI